MRGLWTASLGLGGVLCSLVIGCTDVANSSVGTLANPSQAAATMLAHDVAEGMAQTQVGKILYASDRTQMDGYAYCSLSGQLANRGEFRAAVEAALKGLYLGVTTADHRLLIDAERDLAYAYELAGDDRSATLWANEALRNIPSFDKSNTALEVAGPVHKTLGDVALREGQPADAVRHYRLALDRSLSNFQWVIQGALANALSQSGDRSGAETALAQARLGPSSYKPYFDRLAGEIALRNGDLATATSDFDQAAREASGIDAAYHRAWALIGKARSERQRGEFGCCPGRLQTKRLQPPSKCVPDSGRRSFARACSER